MVVTPCGPTQSTFREDVLRAVVFIPCEPSRSAHQQSCHGTGPSYGFSRSSPFEDGRSPSCHRFCCALEPVCLAQGKFKECLQTGTHNLRWRQSVQTHRVCIDVRTACSFTRRSPARKNRRGLALGEVCSGSERGKKPPSSMRSLHDPGSRRVDWRYSSLGLYTVPASIWGVTVLMGVLQLPSPFFSKRVSDIVAVRGPSVISIGNTCPSWLSSVATRS